MDDVGRRPTGSFLRMLKKPFNTLPIVSPVSCGKHKIIVLVQMCVFLWDYRVVGVFNQTEVFKRETNSIPCTEITLPVLQRHSR